MFIDIHVHTTMFESPLKIDGKKWHTTVEELIERYDQIGIEAGAVLPVVNPEYNYSVQSNEEVLAIAQRYPKRIIPFCNIDPRFITNLPDAPLDKLLGQYKDKGCKGVGEICPNLPFTDTLVWNLFKHTERVGLPLTFHIATAIGGTYGLYDDPGLPQLEKSLQQFPKLKFFGHSQAFWSEITVMDDINQRKGYPFGPVNEEGAVVRLMRKYPNLYGDLSAGSGYNALARDPEYAVKFLNEFQDRLMFGTDICAPDTPTPLVDFLIGLRNSGKISELVFNKVARENAVRLLEV
jgi:uncharacterized protein